MVLCASWLSATTGWRSIDTVTQFHFIRSVKVHESVTSLALGRGSKKRGSCLSIRRLHVGFPTVYQSEGCIRELKVDESVNIVPENSINRVIYLEN